MLGWIGKLGLWRSAGTTSPVAPPNAAAESYPHRPANRDGFGYRGYDAGRIDRRDADFNPPMMGPNLDAEQTLALAVNRHRHLCDNHPLISGARRKLVNNVVGAGITLEADTGFEDLDAQLDERWEVLAAAVDAGRELSLGEQQREFMCEVFAGGDALVRDVMAPAWRDHAAGPVIELIERERVDAGTLTTTMARPGENTIRQGVEVDSLGRRVAYYVLPNHPADGVFSGVLRGVRVSAMDASLAMLRTRRGQLRGLPMALSVVALTRFAQKYGDAALSQALAAACLGVYLKGVTAPGLRAKGNKAPTQDTFTDVDGEPIEELEPGLVGFLPSGADLVSVVPNAPGPQFVDVHTMLERQEAAGIGMGFAEYTGDWGRMTFSSSRSEALDTRRFYRPLQVMVVAQHSARLWRAAVRHWVAQGLVKLTAEQARVFAEFPTRLYRIKATPPGWEWVDPEKEVNAALKEIGGVLNSPQNVCANRGQDFYKIAEQVCDAEKFWNDLRVKKGLEPLPLLAAIRQLSGPGGGGAPPNPNDPNSDEPPAAPAPKRKALEVGGGGRMAHLNGVNGHA
ncbi:MAG: phage portal protein [Phycisphaerales bacterium]